MRYAIIFFGFFFLWTLKGYSQSSQPDVFASQGGGGSSFGSEWANDPDEVRKESNVSTMAPSSSSVGACKNTDALYSAICDGNLNGALTMIQQGASVENLPGYRFDGGKTVLHKAVEQNNLEALNGFLNYKVDINAQDADGNTALLLAVFNNNLATLEALLVKKASPDVENKKHIFPLYQAIINSDYDQVELLVNNGAILDHKLNDGLTLLHYSLLSSDNSNINVLLIKSGASLNIKVAVTRADNSSLSFITQEKEVTPLHLAVILSKKQEVDAMYQRDASILEVPTGSGDYPIHIVTQMDNSEMLDFLVARKVNLDTYNKSGETALLYAIQNMKQGIIEQLLLAGADPYLRTQYEPHISGLELAWKLNMLDVIKSIFKSPREPKDILPAVSEGG